MTKISQEAREAEVTQADREAALPILCHLYVRKGEEPALFIAEVKAGKYDDHYQIQALARHRHQAERETLARMEWRDIESAPKDGSWFTAYWPVQTFEDRVQTTRWLHDDCRFVDASDFMDHIQPIAWMPLPPAPEAGQ